jgi:hypothetical protein
MGEDFEPSPPAPTEAQEANADGGLTYLALDVEERTLSSGEVLPAYTRVVAVANDHVAQVKHDVGYRLATVDEVAAERAKARRAASS